MTKPLCLKNINDEIAICPFSSHVLVYQKLSPIALKCDGLFSPLCRCPKLSYLLLKYELCSHLSSQESKILLVCSVSKSKTI